MRKRILCAGIFLAGLASAVHAQESTGFNLSPTGGVLAVSQNPAQAFSTYLKADIHLFSLNVVADNNYLSLNQKKLFSGEDIGDILQQETGVSSMNALLQVEALGPSFMIRLTPKAAMAFATKARVLVNVDGVPAAAAKKLYDILLDEGVADYSFAGDYTSVNANGWLEYALTYARLLLERGRHRIQAGLSLKLLQGISSYSVTLRNYNSQYDAASETVRQVAAELAYGHTQNLTWGNSDNGLLTKEAWGVGLDIGAVYENHPVLARSQDGELKISPDYRFRVGLAILDLGAISYRKKLGSRNWAVNIGELNTGVFAGVESQADINAVINGLAGVSGEADEPGKFVMDLPARISAYLDYRIGEGVYVSLNPVIALSAGTGDDHRTHQKTMCYFSLRLERPWFGICFPGAIGGLGGARLGLGIKAGPLLIGSSSLLGTLLGGKTKVGDVFVGLRIPII